MMAINGPILETDFLVTSPNGTIQTGMDMATILLGTNQMHVRAHMAHLTEIQQEQSMGMVLFLAVLTMISMAFQIQ